jgi:DNA-binding Xre family transcriptional regulator
MLNYNFQRLFRSIGISKQVPFLIKAGFTRNIASRIVNGSFSALSLVHIEKLCMAFKCTPNDLMEWTPKDASLLKANIPLAKLLSSSEPIFDLRNIGEEIPYEKISVFAKKVNELKKQILAAK